MFARGRVGYTGRFSCNETHGYGLSRITTRRNAREGHITRARTRMDRQKNCLPKPDNGPNLLQYENRGHEDENEFRR